MTYRTNAIASIILVYTISLICLYLLIDYTWICALIMVVNFTTCVINCWNISLKRLQPFILFLFTFGLFILGRFFTTLLGWESDWWEPTFFSDYHIDNEDKIRILFFTLSFLSFISIGYIFGKIKYPNRFYNISINKHFINKILQYSFIILSIITIISKIQLFNKVLAGGYLELYLSNQNEEYSGSNLLIILSYVFFGLAFGYGNAINRKFYLILFIFNACISILMGGRGSFGALLLVLLWLYSQNHKISMTKIALSCCGSIIILLTVFSFSIRAGENATSTLTVYEIMMKFLYDQGISLMVFDASTIPNNYPLIAYFQSIFPGVSVIYSYLDNTALQPWDIAFSSYMCHYLNPDLFSSGLGLGWTAMSDVYLFSFRYIPLYLIISFFIGLILSWTEIGAKSSQMMKSILYCIIFQLLIFPRGGLNSIIPLIFYLLVVTAILGVASKSLIITSTHR